VKAAVLHRQGEIRYEEVEIPGIAGNEILVRVKATGICGSDIPRVLGTAAHFYPIVLGHEFSGEVVEVGPDVTSVAVGERVAVAPLVPCNRCRDCAKGDYSVSQLHVHRFTGTGRLGGVCETACTERSEALRWC
jgi:L-iditol 2-dehydrogenase